jgi:homotetrameric cytidine deaminase
MGFVSLESAFQLALRARQNSFSPYSKFAVGSVVKLAGVDHLYSGCNIENASFSATVCAERVALWKALSEHPGSKVDTVLLVTDAAVFDPPCGVCLQTISQFADAQTELVLANLRGVQKIVRFHELLPVRFEGF